MAEVFVLDSYAVLALLGREPGSEDVADLFRRAAAGQVRLLITWINLGEVAYIVERRWGEKRLRQVLGTLQATAMEVLPVGQVLALAAAHLKARHPLSYADALAAALAMQADAALVTGDPEFRVLEQTLAIQWLPRSS